MTFTTTHTLGSRPLASDKSGDPEDWNYNDHTTCEVLTGGDHMPPHTDTKAHTQAHTQTASLAHITPPQTTPCADHTTFTR